MIDPGKLSQLESGQKRRKIALTLGALERDIDGVPEKGCEYNYKSISRQDYLKCLVEIILKDPLISSQSSEALKSCLEEKPLNEKRLCNLARNTMLAIIGTFPAEWDLVIAPHPEIFDEKGVVKQREFYSDIYVYAEDIRSPFNLGSIFRTAEAMGAEKVFVSPLCVPPDHPKALRSGMGCIETLGYEVMSLDQLEKFASEKELPIFVLETGGTDIAKFPFPKRGICIIGSEELGVSPAALEKAKYGCATIPMKGLKASLNVGVAFGILMRKWTESLV